MVTVHGELSSLFGRRGPCRLLVSFGTFRSISSNKGWYIVNSAIIENAPRRISHIHVQNVSQELVNPSGFSASGLSTDADTGAWFKG